MALIELKEVQIVSLREDLEQAILHGKLPRPLDKAFRDEQRNLGQPVDGPRVKGPAKIVTGGKSQELFPERSTRTKWFIQNPLFNTISIFVRTDGEAASDTVGQSIEVVPGDELEDDDPVTQTAIIVFATAPISFYAEESLQR